MISHEDPKNEVSARIDLTPPEPVCFLQNTLFGKFVDCYRNKRTHPKRLTY